MRYRTPRLQLNSTQKFGYLTPISFDRMVNNRSWWFFNCNCGSNISLCAAEVKSGHTSSCGCFRKEITRKLKLSHGFGALKGPRRKFYRAWSNMLTRCLNPKSTEYLSYGGRNITVCDRWLKFENFKDNLYTAYLEHVEKFNAKDTTLDRIDVNGNYEPNNVKWSTRLEQARNTRTSPKTVNFKEHSIWKDKFSMAVRSILFANGKCTKYLLYLSCTPSELKDHIASQFEPWMNWDNHGQGKGKWEIDHIIPCNQFDLSKEEDKLVCFNYKNLRPYDSKLNRERTYKEFKF